MNFIATHLLTLILFSPALAAVVMLFLPSGEKKLLRWTALGASLVPLRAFADGLGELPGRGSRASSSRSSIPGTRR